MFFAQEKRYNGLQGPVVRSEMSTDDMSTLKNPLIAIYIGTRRK